MAASDILFNAASLTVIIVDDHDPIRKAIRRVVQAMGFREVIECFDGDDALKVMNKRPVDLIILDLYMRHITGFDVLEHISNRNISSDIPVLVVTGEASKEEIVKVAHIGAEDYLLKPFQANDLEKKIIKALNRYHSPSPALKAIHSAERSFMSSQFAAALGAFNEAIAIEPQSARAVLGRALTLDRLDKPEEALAALNESLQVNRSYHKTHGAMADILVRLNRIPEAIVAMQHELEINPKQTNRQIHVGKLLLKEGQPKAAIEHFRTALRENSKHLEALMGMGHAVAAADNLDKALYYFKRVRRYHPTATKALEAAIRFAISAGEPRKAELLLKDERTQNPERMEVAVLLAIFYVKQDRDDEALAVATEILEKDPVNAHALRIRGTILFKKKDFAGALAALQQIAKISPSSESFNHVAEAQLILGNIPDCLEMLNKSLAVDSDNPNTFLMLAQAHTRTQQWLKATLLYRRAIALGANKDKYGNEIRECAQHVTARRGRVRQAS